MDIIDLTYDSYRKLFKSMKKVLESDAKPLNKKEFEKIWVTDAKFRNQWNEFIFFHELSCPDCAADLALVTEGKKLKLQLIKHHS